MGNPPFFERNTSLDGMTTELLTERHGSTLVITLSGPATRNVLSNQVIAAGIETLSVAESNPDVSGVVITGAGGQFCAGNDLQHVAHGRHDLEAQAAYMDSFHQWTEALRTFPKPVIAAVEGVALGGGLALALACDLIVAADSARLSAHAHPTALVPEGDISHTLTQALGRARALQFLWQTTPWAASTCAEWGLVQEVVKPGQAVDRAVEWIEAITQAPADIVCGIKELINEGMHNTWRAQINAEKNLALLAVAHGQAPGQGAD